MTDRARCLPWWNVLSLLIGAAALVNASRQSRAAEESLWEFSAYKVQVLVAATPLADTCGNAVNSLVAELPPRCETVIGPRWNLSVAPAPVTVRGLLLPGLDPLTVEQITTAAPEDADKVFLVRIDYDEGGYEISVRDFDVRTQLLGAVSTAKVYHVARLTDAVLQAMLSAFAPLARVEDVSGEKVTMQLRGAAIPTRDPSLGALAAQSIFRPVVRANDRVGKARRIQVIDWTYLLAEGVKGADVQARLVTGLRSPLVSRRRGRVEQLALYLHLPTTGTTLELKAATKDAHPLVGYQVYSHPIDVKETKLLGSTDTRGAIEIEPGDEGVRVLMVKSGATIMARLPLVPGVAAVAVAQMPDDQQRLQVEGLINGFQEELVDLLARRQVLMSRIRSRMRAGKTEEARALLNELRRLRTQQDLSRQLLVERQRRTTDDPRVKRQIEKLFDDTQTVINRYLDPRAIDSLDRELNGSATAQADDEAPKEGL